MTLACMLAIHVPVNAWTMRSIVVFVVVIPVAGRNCIDDSAARIHRGADNGAGYADRGADNRARRADCGADQA
jgi:hypothetical protein